MVFASPIALNAFQTNEQKRTRSVPFSFSCALSEKWSYFIFGAVLCGCTLPRLCQIIHRNHSCKQKGKLCKRVKWNVIFVRLLSRFVGLQLTKIGNIVYIQDIADRETLSEAKPSQVDPSEAKQNKQAFNRILCVMANCLQSLLTSATIEINSKTFFWFICFSFVCWLQTLRFNFGPSTFCVKEHNERTSKTARKTTRCLATKWTVEVKSLWYCNVHLK